MIANIVLAALLGSTLVSANASAAPPADVDALVAKHVAAIGGQAAVDRLHDFELQLVYTEGTFSAKSTLIQARPYYRLVRVPSGPITDQTVLEGYDGAAWEYYGDPGIVLQTVGSAAALARRNAHQFIDVLVDASASGTRLSYVGSSDMGTAHVYVVSARFEDGTSDQVFVDRTTYLIDGIQQNIQMHAFGKNVQTRIEMDDYRPVGGVLMPFRTRQVDVASGKTIDSSTSAFARANFGPDVASFRPPTLAQTPLQTLLADIYQEREDAGAVVQTYRDYRQTSGGKPAPVDAINFIGYQCLKMGDAESAVALLLVNVGDYPASASAHFNLGRALVARGESAQARSQFKRALEIDPTYKRASDALNAMAQNPS